MNLMNLLFINSVVDIQPLEALRVSAIYCILLIMQKIACML